ncbi:MAG: hypothetical protein ACLQRH_13390 [Acidimicrobiales bacterium]
MSLRLRWCLVVAVVAIVLGGFMPRALLTGSFTASGLAPVSTQSAPTFPSGCAGDDCGRSAPVAPTPVLTIAAVVAMTGIVVGVAAGRATRRMRSFVHALPRGAAVVLFRPPQFS